MTKPQLDAAKTIYKDMIGDYTPHYYWFHSVDTLELFWSAVWLAGLQNYPGPQIGMIFVTHASVTLLYFWISPHENPWLGRTTKIVRTEQSLVLLFSTGFVTLQGKAANDLAIFLFVIHLIAMITLLVYNVYGMDVMMMMVVMVVVGVVVYVWVDKWMALS